jgi:hypothetical protein
MVSSPVSDLWEHSLSMFPSGASAKALFTGWILHGVRLLGAQRDCASVGCIGKAEVPMASIGRYSDLGSLDQTDACVGWSGVYLLLLSWSCMQLEHLDEGLAPFMTQTCTAIRLSKLVYLVFYFGRAPVPAP